MSLHQLAKHVQNQGRGNDTMLMHVTPNEVKGLQSLAKAAGGSLSINPNTGLPEAGFLESVLPVAIGAGLMAVGVPSPLMAAGITGLGYTVASGGNLQKGLMAGLGAYGGAGLTAGLTEAGASALSSTGAAVNAAGDQIIAAPEGTLRIPAGASASEAVNIGGAPLPKPSASEALSEGFKQAYDKPAEFFKKNMFPIGATALGVMGMQPQPTLSSQQPSPGYIRPYSFSQTRNPRFGEPGQPYFNQSYTAQTPIPANQYGATMMADGGLATLPDGRLGLNPTYPQSGTLDTTQYATPYQMPTSSENLAASYEMATSPYSGEPIRMAEGGDSKAAVDQYNKMISERAAQEYTRPEEFKQQYYPTPVPVAAPTTPTTPDYGGGVKGLYQYYLGRQPTAEEAAQYSNAITSTGMATPEEAAYFRQYIGPEQASTGFKPTGTDPFSTPNIGGFAGGLGGLPTYSYNPTTGQYTKTGNMQPSYDQGSLQQMFADYQARQMRPDTGGGAAGGVMPYDLGGYSDGGRLLKGPGDGVSDSIPATIGNKQPARLADGEFVVPARIVSELGNGSTDAGARKLYGMMDRIQKKRKKSVKGKSFAIDSKAEDALPA